MPYNIENSDLDVNTVITMTENCIITGSNGTEFYFLRLRQYVMCGITEPVRVLEPCNSCPNKVKYVKYWKVCIDSEEFLIPYDYAVIEGKLRTVFHQDMYQNKIKKYYDHPKDYKMVYKDVFGIDVNTGGEEVANQQLLETIEKKRYANDGRTYGTMSYAERDPTGREVPTDPDDTTTDEA